MQEDKKKDTIDENTSASISASTYIVDAISDFASEIGCDLAASVKPKNKSIIDTAENDVLESISQSLTSAKDSIGDFAVNALDGVSETAREIIKGIGDVIGDVMSNIDS